MTKDFLQEYGLTRVVLALLSMAILIAASFWVLHPFLTALVWAATILPVGLPGTTVRTP
jgi:hypothetical protein